VTKLTNDKAAQEGGRRGVRADPGYPVEDRPPELKVLAEGALRVAEERRRKAAGPKGEAVSEERASHAHWTRDDWMAGRIECSSGCRARLSSLDPRQLERQDGFGAVAVCGRCQTRNEIRFVSSVHQRVARAEAAVDQLARSRPRSAQDFAMALSAFEDYAAPPRGVIAPAGPEHYLASARQDIERASQSEEEAANLAIGDATGIIKTAHIELHRTEVHL